MTETRAKKEQEEGKEYKKRGRKQGKNTYLVNFQLYTIRHPKSEKMKPAFKHNGRSYFIDRFDIRRATIKAFEFRKDVIGKKVFRFVTDHDYLKGVGLDGLPSDTFINPEFTKLSKLLSDDTEFHNLVQHLQQY